MTTCEEIQNLLAKSEIENLKYELKSSKILKNNKWKSSLAKEIVALANQHGGKLIIGLQNDGTFDGEADYDVNKLKGDIDNIIHNKISPTIDYQFEFVECEEGDLSIITVEKKKEIPYAYIVKREGPEVKNRIYYIRTPNGKRLVSDQVLYYLFNDKVDFDLIDLDEDQFEMSPKMELINEYLDMMESMQLSPKNLIPILNKLHNEFVKISLKEDFNKNELDTINNYMKSITKYILGNNDDLIKIIIGTVRLLVLKPKLLEIIKNVNYHNFKKLYESGFNNNDIVLILYKCGYFKSISAEIYRAIDKKDMNSLKNFRRLLYSTNIEEDKFLIIRKLRLKIEKLSFNSDIDLINMIESIISLLES